MLRTTHSKLLPFSCCAASAAVSRVVVLDVLASLCCMQGGLQSGEDSQQHIMRAAECVALTQAPSVLWFMCEECFELTINPACVQ